MADEPTKALPRLEDLVPRQTDALDRRIIGFLQTDGRLSNTEIARRLKVTETTVRKRIKALVDDGLVNVVGIPHPSVAGLTVSAIIGIRVQLAKLHQVSDQLRSYPEVRYVGLAAGRYDIIVEAFFTDQEHVLEFVSGRLGDLEGVTAVENSLILKVVKFSYEWQVDVT
ncbi:transcriptional regulator [Asanoa ishikariensis]|uniref:Transcriptional regulator, AsnC family n=1 Tax=Asanoa ishikariensis TaxID=137265 RepID=A0A1H3UCD7_9ACTN|nr:Lrp/AsnC family transcriptional regulator [Asanoa ishikariensis]GIF63953.1 transcriptional regulator [Asanoa ishikariensis]SDZ59505.1 transcriptional regulator, AsnC family [Asanoa ishikariensis]